MFNPKFRSAILPTLCLVASFWAPSPALAHEFWVEPEKYQVDSEEILRANLKNGQMFKGVRLPYLDHRIKRFEIAQQDEITPYIGRMGDMPALVLNNLKPGLLIALHETTPDLITYDSWEEFAEFAAQQGFGDLSPLQRRRGLPDRGFGELYSRHSKLLIAVENGLGEDKEFGLETEFVALQNPYTLPSIQADTSAEMPFQLLYRGTPRQLTQVMVFERDPKGTVLRQSIKTDATGHFVLPVRPLHQYLLNAVVLRPLEDNPLAVWETLWASITFSIPAQHK